MTVQVVQSPQMKNLLVRYAVKNEPELLRRIAREYTRETGCRFTIRDAEAILDGMLEAEYQRIEGGAYDPVPIDDDQCGFGATQNCSHEYRLD